MSPDLNCAALARLHGDAPAVVSSGGLLSFGQLADSIERRVIELREKGARDSEWVALRPELDLNSIILFYALLDMGCRVVLSVKDRTAADLSLAVGQPPSGNIADQAGLSGFSGKSGGGGSPVPRTALFTSGSSGRPKLVMHSSQAHLASARAVCQHLGFGVGKSWLLALPLYHVAGLSLLFRSLVSGGCLIVSPESRRLPTVAALQQSTHVSLVPTQLYRLLDDVRLRSIASSLEALIVGGDHTDPGAVEIARASSIPVLRCYGSTETGSMVTCEQIGHVDSAGNGVVLPGNEVVSDRDGHLCVRGPGLLTGYWEQRQLFRPFDENGWFHTGDEGFVEEQQLGRVSRRGSQIITGGEVIDPTAIEQVFLAMDDVEAVVVTAVRDCEYGQLPVAFVRAISTCLERQRILSYLRRSLPKNQWPFVVLPMPGDLEVGTRNLRTVLAERLDTMGSDVIKRRSDALVIK